MPCSKCGRKGVRGRVCRDCERDEAYGEGNVDDDAVVYVKSKSHAGQRRVYHTDEDCTHLDKATDVIARDRHVLPEEYHECRRCAGEEPKGGNDWSAYQALQRAAKGGD